MKSTWKGQSASRACSQAGGEGHTGGTSSDFQSVPGLSLHSKSGVQMSLPRTFTPAQQRALEAPQEAPPAQECRGLPGLGKGAPPHLGCRPGSRLCHPQGPPPFVSVVAGSLPDRGSPRVTEAAPRRALDSGQPHSPCASCRSAGRARDSAYAPGAGSGCSGSPASRDPISSHCTGHSTLSAGRNRGCQGWGGPRSQRPGSALGPVALSLTGGQDKTWPSQLTTWTPGSA